MSYFEPAYAGVIFFYMEEKMAKFKENSIVALFQNQCDKLGDKACVSYKKDGIYVDLSWNTMNKMVHDLAFYLLSIGIKKGDRVAIFSNNRYEWWVADLAILSIGAIDVPIYSTNSAEEAQYILGNSESKACFAGKLDHMQKVLDVKKKLPLLKNLVMFDMKDNLKNAITIQEAFNIGKKYKNKGEFDNRLKALKPSDVATIIYTSGTTGAPKGVMLTHDNFSSNVKNVMVDLLDQFNPEDTFLSFLPLSHSLERTAGFYIPIKVGCKVAFAEDISTLMQNLQEVRPTLLVSVPRIYEKVHAGIQTKLTDASAIKKLIFGWAMGVAKKNLPYVCKNQQPKGFLAKKIHIADKIIYSKLKVALGLDRMKFAISGGGPLSVADCEFFIGMGIRILEGFGLTETTPVTNYNRPWLLKPGTVGSAIPETTVKISDEGEVLIKGPQVMKGYYKNPKATKETFTKDGFFKTGDIGVIDEDGYLRITGRIKDIIITAGGKNISPQNIENDIKTSQYIEQVAIIGDARKYLTALVIPSFEAVKKWASQKGIHFETNNDLIANEEVNKLIAAEIDQQTKKYSRVEQIRKFKLLVAEWTQETGELTPTQKIKRKIIVQKYAKDIESMYPPEM